MEVDYPREPNSLLIPCNRGSGKIEKGGGRWYETYVLSRKAVIILRISKSPIVVSLNPGVSINTTRRPSRTNGLESWISDVQEWRLVPTLRSSDPLARFANCQKDGRRGLRGSKAWNVRDSFRTEDFPLPVIPISLEAS